MVVVKGQFVRARAKVTSEAPPTAEEILAQLERVLASGDFDASPRSRAFLRFIVEETLAGREDGLTQDAIASQVFHRRDGFDPTIDPIVRIQAGRLRRSLERYYLLEGGDDTLRIELPRGSYVPVLRWAEAREGQPKGALRAPDVADDWPTVIASMTAPARPDPVLDEARAGFLDHLAIELGRYRDVRVVVRREPLPTGASPCVGEGRFALSCRLDDGGRRLVARLVDCRGGSQAWAEEYACGWAPPRAFHEETARVVAASVASEQGVVARRLWTERRSQLRARLTPYGAILASYQFFFNRDPADLVSAIDALKRVVAAEPECGLAWVQLSRLYLANHCFELTPFETPVEQAVAYAEAGVRIDPSSQRARAALAGALLAKGELEASRTEAQAALDLNPESFVYLEWIGWLLTLAGEWQRGPAVVRRALTRNPHVIPVAHHALWLAHLRSGEIEEAYQAALQYRDRTFFLRPMMRACCLGHLARKDDAGAEVAELLAEKPEFRSRGRVLIGRLVKFPDLLEIVVDGLRKVGLALD